MEAVLRSELPMILIRLIVGLVFVLEGLLKFLLPENFGAEHFAAIGFPYAHYLAPTGGGLELCGGVALIFNFYAGEAAILLMVVMTSAIITTKIPLLLGHALGQ